MAVNQDQLRAQVESNMAWSIGMALFEKLEVADNDIQSSNYDNYIIPRMADMPRLDIEIIDQPSILPAGAGEVALIAGPSPMPMPYAVQTAFALCACPLHLPR